MAKSNPHAYDFLKQAISEMEERRATYDKERGERSMGRTVLAFEAITGISLTEEQGWLFMATLKDVRSMQGEYREDNYVDGAAYRGLAGEAAARDRAKKAVPTTPKVPDEGISAHERGLLICTMCNEPIVGRVYHCGNELRCKKCSGDK